MNGYLTVRDVADKNTNLFVNFFFANPPFSLKQWGEDTWNPIASAATSPVFRRARADFAWVQHMITSMAVKRGRLAVVLPQGALFRGQAEGQIREKIVRSEKVEAVIGLAPNLFYGTGLAACRRGPPTASLTSAGRGSSSSTPRRSSSEGAPRTPSSPSTLSRSSAWYQAFEGRPWPRARGRPRGDRGRGLDAQHLPLRAAAPSTTSPTAAGGRRRLQAGAFAEAEQLRTTCASARDEGGWVSTE